MNLPKVKIHIQDIEPQYFFPSPLCLASFSLSFDRPTHSLLSPFTFGLAVVAIFPAVTRWNCKKINLHVLNCKESYWHSLTHRPKPPSFLPFTANRLPQLIYSEKATVCSLWACPCNYCRQTACKGKLTSEAGASLKLATCCVCDQ